MGEPRTSLHFPKEAVAELTSLRHITETTNNAAIIRAALRMLHRILEFASTGDVVIVIGPDGKEWRFSPYSRCDCPDMTGIARPIGAECKDKKVAQNFFFSGDIVDIIKSIREKSSYLENNADVIRIALTKYWQLSAAVSQGRRIIVRCADGLEYLFNPHAPQQRCPNPFSVTATPNPV